MQIVQPGALRPGQGARSREAEAHKVKASNPQALDMMFKGIFLDEGRRILS